MNKRSFIKTSLFGLFIPVVTKPLWSKVLLESPVVTPHVDIPYQEGRLYVSRGNDRIDISQEFNPTSFSDFTNKLHEKVRVGLGMPEEYTLEPITVYGHLGDHVMYEHPIIAKFRQQSQKTLERRAIQERIESNMIKNHYQKISMGEV